MDDLGGKPKDKLVTILDRIEMHVEQLRKDALRIEEEKDTLLTTLDTLRNNDMVVGLEASKFQPLCLRLSPFVVTFDYHFLWDVSASKTQVTQPHCPRPYIRIVMSMNGSMGGSMGGSLGRSMG
jgi:hypothetical protein